MIYSNTWNPPLPQKEIPSNQTSESVIGNFTFSESIINDPIAAIMLNFEKKLKAKEFFNKEITPKQIKNILQQLNILGGIDIDDKFESPLEFFDEKGQPTLFNIDTTGLSSSFEEPF